MFIIYIMAMVSWVYTYVETSVCTFKYVQFIVCKLYFNKPVKVEEKTLEIVDLFLKFCILTDLLFFFFLEHLIHLLLSISNDNTS